MELGTVRKKREKEKRGQFRKLFSLSEMDTEKEREGRF